MASRSIDEALLSVNMLWACAIEAGAVLISCPGGVSCILPVYPDAL